MEQRYKVINRSTSVPHQTIVDFNRWQKDAHKIMKENSCLTSKKICRIHLIHDTSGCSGKYTFIRALQYSDPNRFLVLFYYGSIHEADLSIEARQARIRGWNGDSCIIIAIIERLDARSCHILERLVSGMVVINHSGFFVERWSPVNVWLFVRSLPDLSLANASKWRIFNVEGDLTRNYMSSLKEVPFYATSLQ